MPQRARGDSKSYLASVGALGFAHVFSHVVAIASPASWPLGQRWWRKLDDLVEVVPTALEYLELSATLVHGDRRCVPTWNGARRTEISRRVTLNRTNKGDRTLGKASPDDSFVACLATHEQVQCSIARRRATSPTGPLESDGEHGLRTFFEVHTLLRHRNDFAGTFVPRRRHDQGMMSEPSSWNSKAPQATSQR